MAEVGEFAYLRVNQSAGQLIVSYHPPPTLLVERRKKIASSAARLFRRGLSRIGAARGDGGFLVQSDKLAELSYIDRRIAAIVAAPLSGAAVERLLGITGEERRRWTRDGRLPTCAKSVAGRSGHLFSLPLYAADIVLQLDQRPATIASWREADVES
jgi:hypothetical protein